MKQGEHLKYYRLPKIYNEYKLFKHSLSKVSKEDINWITGFYEGEGSVGYWGNITISFMIGQKEITPLLYIKKTLKEGIIRTNNEFSIFSINGSGRILALLEKMLPYMKSKVRIIKTKEVLKLLRKLDDYH